MGSTAVAARVRPVGRERTVGIEEAVLHLLQAKLNLFELVIGEIDMILGNLEEEREFEDVVADLWAESDDMGDFRKRMEVSTRSSGILPSVRPWNRPSGFTRLNRPVIRTP